MRFIVKRLGLIIWVCVVVSLLFIPAWRLRAQRQGQTVIEKLEARFEPAQTTETLVEANSALPPDDPEVIAEDELSTPWEREVARRLPDDPLAQIAPIHRPSGNRQMAPNEPRVNENIARYFARYDALERRFPASNAVRAQRLRDATIGEIPLSIPLGPDKSGKSYPAPPIFIEQRVQMEAALQSARAGARREPDNAYFPWMEAVFSFALRRDADAIAALRRAGDCPRFDDYLISNARGRLALLNEVQPTGWEDDYTQVFGILLPHLARMYYASTAMTDRARQARKSGDEARALELAGITQRAGAAMARANLLITRRAGENIVVRAWKFALEDQANLPVAPKDDYSWPSTQTAARETAYQQAMATRFEVYARANKRFDLASQAQTIASRFDASSLLALYGDKSHFNIFQRLSWLGRTWWGESIALTLGALASLAWIVAWPFSRRSQNASARRGALQAAMFMAGVTPVFLIGFLVRVPSVANSQWSYAYSEPPTAGALLWLHDNYLFALVVLWLAPALGALLLQILRLLSGIQIARLKRSGKIDWPALGRALLIFGFVVGGAGVALGIGQTANSIFAQLFLYFMALFLGNAFVGSVLMLAFLRGPARVIALCAVLAFWAGTAPSILFASQGDGPFYGSISTAIALLAVAIGIFVALRTWKISFSSFAPHLKNLAFEFAARTRIAAAVLALLCAVAYFGIALWTIPVEAKTRAMMERQLQIGEVAWLREQVAARK